MYTPRPEEYGIYFQQGKELQVKELKDLIEKKNILRKSSIHLKTFVKKLFIVQNGCIEVSIEADQNFTVKNKKIFFVELGQRLIISAQEDSTILIFRLPNFIGLNEHLPLEKLALIKNDIVDAKDLPRILSLNDTISYNIDLICEFIEQVPQYALYFKLKIKEFLLILSNEYSLYELYGLFAETTSVNISFSDEVKKNVHKYNKMADLADAMHYTTSGFEKRFKRIFNMSPYHWMKEMKARRLYYDLKMTDKDLKDLCDDYGFKSNNYFIEFCISNLGASPSAIRKSSEHRNPAKEEEK